MEKSKISPVYKLIDNAPKTINDLILQIEFNFLTYLNALEIAKSQKERIKALLKSKGGLKIFLNDVYKGRFNLESYEILDIQNLRKFLESISEIGQEIIDKFPGFKDFQTDKSGSPLQLAGIYYFNDESIITQDMIIIETFFRSYLLNKYIVLSEESKIDQENSLNLYYFSSMIQNQLLLYTTYAEIVLNISKAKEVTQLLLFLIKNTYNFSQKQIEDFGVGVEEIDFKENSEKPILDLLKLIKDIFPEIYSIENTKYKVSAILLGKYNENNPQSFSLRLISDDNFYFRKTEEIISDNDIFPKAGNMIYDYKDRIEGMKDICIFDTNGNKVFWGDIGEKDLISIRGTYYILTQSEGWRDVPEFAQGNIRALKSVVDNIGYNIRVYQSTIPNDVLFLIPEYVRALAIGKIEEGKYIKNPRKIKL